MHTNTPSTNPITLEAINALFAKYSNQQLAEVDKRISAAVSGLRAEVDMDSFPSTSANRSSHASGSRQTGSAARHGLDHSFSDTRPESERQGHDTSVSRSGHPSTSAQADEEEYLSTSGGTDPGLVVTGPRLRPGCRDRVLELRGLHSPFLAAES